MLYLQVLPLITTRLILLICFFLLFFGQFPHGRLPEKKIGGQLKSCIGLLCIAQVSFHRCERIINCREERCHDLVGPDRFKFRHCDSSQSTAVSSEQ